MPCWGMGVGFTLTGAFGTVDLELKLLRLQQIFNGNIVCNVDRPYAISIMDHVCIFDLYARSLAHTTVYLVMTFLLYNTPL